MFEPDTLPEIRPEDIVDNPFYVDEILRLARVLADRTEGMKDTPKLRAVAMVRLAHEHIDATVLRARQEFEKSENPIACKSGCAHCCYLAADVHKSEADAIAGHLVATKTDAELDRIEDRLSDMVRDWRESDFNRDYYFMKRRRCAFLSPTDTCTIYEMRPLSCRAHHSMSAERCAGGSWSMIPKSRSLETANIMIQSALSLAIQGYIGRPVIKNRSYHNIAMRVRASLRTVRSLSKANRIGGNDRA